MERTTGERTKDSTSDRLAREGERFLRFVIPDNRGDSSETVAFVRKVFSLDSVNLGRLFI